MLPEQPHAQRALLGVLAALAMGLAAGCSDERAVVEPRPFLEVTLDDYAITPQSVSVPSGSVEIVARNVGRLTHNLRIEVPPGTPDDEPKELATTPTAQPGQTVRVTVELGVGRYGMRCTLANHDDLGERGTLIVRSRGRGG
jgi:hypothetical protein